MFDLFNTQATTEMSFVFEPISLFYFWINHAFNFVRVKLSK